MDNVDCVDIKIMTMRPSNFVKHQTRSESSNWKSRSISIETFDDSGFYAKMGNAHCYYVFQKFHFNQQLNVLKKLVSGMKIQKEELY